MRWKAAEKEALQHLSDEEKGFVTPLVEIIMPHPKSSKKKNGEDKTPQELLEESISMLSSLTPKIPQEILRFWGRTSVFIDINLIDESVRIKSLSEILEIGELLETPLVPVIGLNTKRNIQDAIVSLAKKYNHGLCLRLFRSDFTNQTTLAKRVIEFLKLHELSEERTDLLVDFQIADNQSPKINEVIQHIPTILKWRTFIMASGSFPPDLTRFTIDLHFIPRHDWIFWMDQINSGKLLRKPSFADYIIQHPIYREPVRGANPSASIRYTLNEKWMIMRGQGLRSPKSAGHAQYPALAQLLARRPEFFGEKFSFGDQYIAEKGRDINTIETGTPRTWLRAGINHHLACVVSQISTLS
jgi:hypothetical protein